MDKLLVRIKVPVLNQSFDMFIPNDLRIYEVLGMIKRAITELSDGIFIADRCNILYYQESGDALDFNQYVCESNMYNGVKLVLI